ncbi:DUF2871 domain-containing protein [Microbacterium keratanolyticum]
MTENTATHHRTLRILLGATAVYAVLGLAAGLFYREFTKANGYPEGFAGQLGLAHTHILTLGMLVLLIVLILEKVFRLSTSRLLRWFFWIYNLGVVLTTALLVWHGILQVKGLEGSGMISGIAGLGHILIGAGFVLLLLNLNVALRRDARAAIAS